VNYYVIFSLTGTNVYWWSVSSLAKWFGETWGQFGFGDMTFKPMPGIRTRYYSNQIGAWRKMQENQRAKIISCVYSQVNHIYFQIK